MADDLTIGNSRMAHGIRSMTSHATACFKSVLRTVNKVLQIEELPFDATDGNILGFARGRSIAVSPINPLPHKTRFHELAHVLLGHTAEGAQADGELTPRSLRECEAEAAAMLCCAALDLPGVEFSRGYIQSWWGVGNPIPERSAQRILKAADQILKAGTVDRQVLA
jgi:hypothetical protein